MPLWANSSGHRGDAIIATTMGTMTKTIHGPGPAEFDGLGGCDIQVDRRQKKLHPK